MGDIDRGYAWLTKARDDRSFEVLALKIDPRFDTLRDDERFGAAVKRVGLS